RAPIPLRVEAYVLIRVLDVHRPPGLRDPARQALAHHEEPGVGATAVREPRPKLATVFDQEARRVIGVHDARDPRQQDVDEFIQVQGRTEGLTDILQRPELTLLPLE